MALDGSACDTELGPRARPVSLGDDATPPGHGARGRSAISAAMGLLGRTRPGQPAQCGDSIAARGKRKTIVSPSLEPADDITGSVEAELDEVARGKDR